MLKRMKTWLEGLNLVTASIIGLVTAGALATPLVSHYYPWGPGKDAREAYGRGLSYFGAHDYDRAEAEFSRAIASDKDYGDALFSRARARASLHDYSGAIEDLRILRTLEPDVARGYTLAGFSFFNLRDFPQVEVELNKALILSPDDKLALFTRAQYFAWKHDYARAAKDLQHLLVIEPLSKKGLTLLAGAYSRLGEADKAAQNCRQLLRIDRRDARAPELCGVIHHRAGEYEAAIGYYDAALKLDPINIDIRTNRDRASAGLPPLGSLDNMGV